MSGPTTLPSTLSAGEYSLELRSERHRQQVVSALSKDDDIARWTRVPFPYVDADYDFWLTTGDSHFVILEGDVVQGAVGAILDAESQTAEVGYWLLPAARGKGAATQALGALCEALFEAGYERLCADVHPDNEVSKRVLKRSGFRFEGIQRSVYEPRCGLGAPRQDQARFSLLPGDRSERTVESSLERTALNAPTNAVVNLDAALATFDELWSPRIVGRVDDHKVQIAKVRGEHLWHAHVDADEFFMVIDGELSISLRDAEDVVLTRGEFFVVPRGVEHRPHSKPGASILLFERSGTLSTGSYTGEVPAHIDSTLGRSIVG